MTPRISVLSLVCFVGAALVCSAQVYIPGGTAGITSISGSNVGVGASTPEATLHVDALYLTQPTFKSRAWPTDAAVPGGLFYGRATTAGVLQVTAGGNSPSGPSNILVLTPDGTASAPVLVVNRAGRLGLGADDPDSLLHIKTSVGGSSVHIVDGGYTGGMYLGATGNDSAGSIGFGAQNVTGSWTARDTSAALWNANAGSGVAFRVLAGTSLTFGSAFTPTELLRVTTDGKFGIGTTTPSHKLAVNGTVRAKEVIVDTDWADHVFADGYRLASLAEVEAHIREKRHLPGIPPAADVAERGISVGEMQAKLLEKIEELTLHQIAQERLIRRYHEELATVRNELAELRRERAEP